MHREEIIPMSLSCYFSQYGKSWCLLSLLLHFCYFAFVKDALYLARVNRLRFYSTEEDVSKCGGMKKLDLDATIL